MRVGKRSPTHPGGILKRQYLELLGLTISEFSLKLGVRPDFVLLDIRLPDISGTDVLKMIRTNKIIKNIPVIVVTSYAMSGDREMLMKAGSDGYIEKPINPKIFISQIEEVLTAD